MATGMIINTLIEAFFMPNCANFSELIRTGQPRLRAPQADRHAVPGLVREARPAERCAISCCRWPCWATPAVSSAGRPLSTSPCTSVWSSVGVAFFYSLMVVLASTSVWFGRNQGLYEFWFYITIFARYPRDFYVWRLVAAGLLRLAFSYRRCRSCSSSPCRPRW